MRNDVILILEKDNNLKDSIGNVLLTYAKIIDHSSIDNIDNEVDFIVIKDEGQFTKEEFQGIVNYCELRGAVSVLVTDTIRESHKPEKGNIDVVITTKDAMESSNKEQLFYMHSSFLYYDKYLSVTLEEYLGFGTYYKSNIITFNQKKTGGNAALGIDNLCAGIVAGLVCDFTLSMSSLLATYLFNINTFTDNGLLPSRNDFVQYLTLKKKEGH